MPPAMEPTIPPMAVPIMGTTEPMAAPANPPAAAPPKPPAMSPAVAPIWVLLPWDMAEARPAPCRAMSSGRKSLPAPLNIPPASWTYLARRKHPLSREGLVLRYQLRR
ncbi:hypothetical protein [Marinomonas polaris]|uniref:hypothetical protein n=1 Tax=Marinomonas polaris TaxID=293552 RepID=UPI003F9CD930